MVLSPLTDATDLQFETDLLKDIQHITTWSYALALIDCVLRFTRKPSIVGMSVPLLMHFATN